VVALRPDFLTSVLLAGFFSLVEAAAVRPAGADLTIFGADLLPAVDCAAGPVALLVDCAADFVALLVDCAAGFVALLVDCAADFVAFFLVVDGAALALGPALGTLPDFVCVVFLAGPTVTGCAGTGAGLAVLALGFFVVTTGGLLSPAGGFAVCETAPLAMPATSAKM